MTTSAEQKEKLFEQEKKEGLELSKQQKEAVETFGKGILVSAAAGSGKTHTLIERIKYHLIKGTYSVNEILLVTFTNAAANQMKEKLEKKLTELLPEHPELEKQLVMLPLADISTVHAFCQKLIRQNFSSIENLDPAFRIAQAPELQLVKRQALKNVFEKKYASQDKNFLKFARLYGSNRNDDDLYKIILELFYFSQSQPNPKEWLQSLVEKFDVDEKNFFETNLFQEWKSFVKSQLESIKKQNKMYQDITKKLMQDDPQKEEEFKKVIDIFEHDLKLAKKALELFEEGNWDELHKHMNRLTFKQFPSSVTKNFPKFSNFLKKYGRDKLKAQMQSLQAKFFTRTIKETIEDLKDVQPIIKTMIDTTIDFMEEFSTQKSQRGIVDFNDLEQYTLELLKNDEIRKHLREKYKEILVDEYQDTNEVQETIFTSLAQLNETNLETNLFTVGDSKQSIYRFRLADSTIFTRRQEKFEKNGQVIFLSENFRSRETILSFANFIFSQLMHQPHLELEYDQKVALHPKATFPDDETKKTFKDEPVEVNILQFNSQNETASKNKDDEDAETEEAIETEARLIADRVEKLLRENFVVYDQDKKDYFPLKKKDIVILTRTNAAIPFYVEALRKKNIETYAQIDDGFFEATEIRLMLSLLSIIDNPRQDIHLAAVLRSPLVGLSEEELAKIHLERPDDAQNFYDSLLQFQEKNETVKNFLQQLATWRALSRRISVAELLHKIFQDTSYYDCIGATTGGLLRQANLRILMNHAKEYETKNFRGLFRFLQFIEQIQEQNQDLSIAKISGENEDVVSVMTVHKSKGLEFPVVILAELGRRFNDQTSSLAIHKELGLGAFCVKMDEKSALKFRYPTITRNVIVEKLKQEDRAEEMRILYVALTRAKEKLLLFGRTTKSCDFWCRYLNYPTTALDSSLVIQESNWLDWICLALAREKNSGKKLRDFRFEKLRADINYDEPKFSIKFYLNGEDKDAKKNKQEQQSPENISQKNLPENHFDLNEKTAKQLELEIEEKLAWIYPHENVVQSKFPLKMTATEVKERLSFPIEDQTENLVESTETEFSLPTRLEQKEDNLTSGMIFGTLMHSALQKIQLIPGKFLTQDEITQQIQNFQEFSEEERNAIKSERIFKFFDSPLGRRMQRARKIWREQPFTMLLESEKIEPTLSDETFFLQGIIDLFFEDEDGKIVLIDYKTDRGTTPDEIKARYQAQLKVYAQAIEKILQKPVDEIYLYRLRNDDAVQI